jgi:hypothetical protein
VLSDRIELGDRQTNVPKTPHVLNSGTGGEWSAMCSGFVTPVGWDPVPTG